MRLVAVCRLSLLQTAPRKNIYNKIQYKYKYKRKENTQVDEVSYPLPAN